MIKQEDIINEESAPFWIFFILFTDRKRNYKNFIIISKQAQKETIIVDKQKLFSVFFFNYFDIYIIIITICLYTLADLI